MKNALIGLCAGIGTGLAVGLLFAPRSGEKTRAMIQDTANEGLRQVHRQRRKLERSVLRLRRSAAEQGEAVKAAWETGKRNLRTRMA